MIENRTLMRLRVKTVGDNSVQWTERVEVQIRWPGNAPDTQKPLEYIGEWRLLPNTVYGKTPEPEPDPNEEYRGTCCDAIDRV